ncbi:MAG: Ig-like domain-containing protein [Acidobacteria bacterium]|nr:Ig-like domain-containing protein [Acidobacteriota bacterium]
MSTTRFFLAHSMRYAFARLLTATFLLTFIFYLDLIPSVRAQTTTTLVPTGATWKYLDNGTDQGTAWQAVSFDDSSWASGAAELGYGDSSTTTVVSYGPSPGNKYITTYFRRAFTVVNTTDFQGLTLRVKRDDGVVVYLNGTEVYRDNIPAGAVSYTTLASNATDNGTIFLQSAVSASLLTSGTNVLAVEIHQTDKSSSDISFDLELKGTLTPSGNTFVAFGSPWKYLDNGSNQGTSWVAPAFDDSSWASGPAELGYGNGDEATVVSYGQSSSNKYITTYFRKAFSVVYPPSFSTLSLSVKRDDGIVVYLNGNEVYRSNMPSGAISYTTPASSSAANDGNTVIQSNISATSLVSGTNVLAVEIHQLSPSDPDISFDLELTGSGGALATNITRGPYVQMGTPASMVVCWRTDTPTDSRVRYGTSLSNLNLIAVDSAMSTEHSVLLTDMSPNTAYYYSFGTSSLTLGGGDSSYFFVTSPTSAKPTRIWVLGDPGTTGSGQTLTRDGYYNFTGTRFTDLWLMLGDNAYDSGTDAEYQRAIFDFYPTTLKQSVLWPTIGNHDTAGLPNPVKPLPYHNIFVLPKNGEAGGVASGTEDYYSFNYGNIHFVCLDSFTSARTPGSPMLTWLQNDLANNTKEWLIAFWHHPPYSKGSHNSDEEDELVEMRQHILPILENYGVDLVLCGHSHAYERSYLIDGHYSLSFTLTGSMIKNGGDGRPAGSGAYTKATLGPGSHQGAVYVVAGSAGMASGGTLNHPAMFISLNNRGALVIDIDSNRLDVTYLRDTGAIDDSFTIIKGVSSSNVPPTVSLTSPASGAAFNALATVTITADASDSDGTITKVDFYQGTTLLGTDTTAPYEFTWSNVVAGNYSLTVRATDNSGGVMISSATSITVNPSAPPTVSLTSPASGATFSPPATVTITADASDSDGTISKVDFYRGTTLLGTDTTAPYEFTWSNVAAGSYSLTAKATDNSGGVTTSSAVSITVSPNPPPTVSLTSPASGSTFAAYSTITITADASDSNGTVTKVDFYRGSTLLGTDTIAPYEFTWSNVSPGSYPLTAKATDNGGAVTTSSAVSITVNPNVPPVITLTGPANGATFTALATITITADASDSDGTISKVDFYRGTSSLGSDTTAPYEFTWTNVTAGTYTLKVSATDNGLLKTYSSEITITVNPNQPPTVSLTSPSSGATFIDPATITITADAADVDGTVTKVDFYRGSTLLGTDTTAPYEYTWSNVDTGNYTLRAKATSDNGAYTYSGSVNITVYDVLPSAPSDLTAAASSSSQIDLSWTDNSPNENIFRIERSTNGTSFAQIGSVGAGVTTYSDTGLTANTIYYYRVRANNSAGNSAYTNTASATTPQSP